MRRTHLLADPEVWAHHEDGARPARGRPRLSHGACPARTAGKEFFSFLAGSGAKAIKLFTAVIYELS